MNRTKVAHLLLVFYFISCSLLCAQNGKEKAISLEKALTNLEQLYNINIELLKHHCYYNDWKKGNVLVKNGKIYLIDFGWCPYILEDYSLFL